MKRRGTRRTREIKLKQLTFSTTSRVPRLQMVAGNKGNKAGRNARLVKDGPSTMFHHLFLLRIGWPSTMSVPPFGSSTAICRAMRPRRWLMRMLSQRSARGPRCGQVQALLRPDQKSVPHVPRPALVFPGPDVSNQDIENTCLSVSVPLVPCVPRSDEQS